MDDDGDILLVEDNPADIELTLRAFARNNIVNRIYVVRDGEEAIQYLYCTGPYATRNVEHRPRLILLDLKMPKLNGLEVLRRIKSDERTRSIPVVVLTSSREERDIVESYHLGVNSYIVKPLEFEEFHESVRQLGLYWLLLNKTPGL